MIKKIFKSTLGVSLLTFLCSMLIIMGALYQYFNNQLMKELENEANYVSASVELLGEKYFEKLKTKNRITWIDEDGVVLYDNVANIDSMENHSDREEYIEAVEKGYGQSERVSDTLSQKTVYYAVLLENGSVVRVSTTQFTILTLLLNMLQPISIMILVAVILSAILASKVAKKIVAPINEIDLENPSLEENYDELSDFIRKIRKQNKIIENQINELERRQKEFKAITENMSEGFIIIDKNTEKTAYEVLNEVFESLEEIEDYELLELVMNFLNQEKDKRKKTLLCFLIWYSREKQIDMLALYKQDSYKKILQKSFLEEKKRIYEMFAEIGDTSPNLFN